jgi:hypothetical protein
MLDLIPLAFVRDSGKPFSKLFWLPDVLGPELAVSCEECIAASIRARGKSVAVLLA